MKSIQHSAVSIQPYSEVPSSMGKSFIANIVHSSFRHSSFVIRHSVFAGLAGTVKNEVVDEAGGTDPGGYGD